MSDRTPRRHIRPRLGSSVILKPALLNSSTKGVSPTTKSSGLRGIFFKIMGHHKGRIDHFIRLGRDAEPGQLGGIVLPCLNRSVGKENNFSLIFSEPPDYTLCSRDELVASIDRSIQIEDKTFKHLSRSSSIPPAGNCVTMRKMTC